MLVVNKRYNSPRVTRAAARAARAAAEGGRCLLAIRREGGQRGITFFSILHITHNQARAECSRDATFFL